ncbi:hypothetical protein EJD97_014345 [Solanum chilense]|uniref:Uncharacterized protein n=1 Tax=Solanum chilense TaxID=4083 RepID=A0A6N2CFX7_SOLCI|nr:hypothetical protein EJD97_014345 [Solanum chilense]
MINRRSAGRIIDEDFANSEVPPRGNQFLPLDENSNDDQDQVNPPLFTDAKIRETFLQMAQDITTQAQAVITKAQAITTEANREVAAQGNKYVGIMASQLRYFTRMHASTFYGSMVKEAPQ